MAPDVITRMRGDGGQQLCLDLNVTEEETPVHALTAGGGESAGIYAALGWDITGIDCHIWIPSPVEIPRTTQVVRRDLEGLPEQHPIIRLTRLVDSDVDLIGKHSVLQGELSVFPQA